jgi:hypothetical protein
MEISTVRDYVIVILGCLCIILTIGIITGSTIAYLELRHLLSSVNNTLRSIQRWLAYVRGLAKGLNESVNLFK